MGPRVRDERGAEPLGFHTYQAHTRGVDVLWNMYQWLDRAPEGRNEDVISWMRRRDSYDAAPVA